ncbi:copper amine oxidase N-terminal domain-containing protein [Paenibacillus solisilvae]|uniref:Copper amine oxidase N-terminal domain-containing protein n=1 Tax=Paenibacillus solisilvae TaxID=2486751 RepID=A0ABW0VVJ1_9BACL
MFTGRIFTGMIAFLLFTGIGGTSASAATGKASKPVKSQSLSVTLNFDGRNLMLPAGQYAFAIQGTTYVPLRFIAYALLKNVEWDGKSSAVIVTAPNSLESTYLVEYLDNAVAEAGKESTKGGITFTVSPIQSKFSFGGVVNPLPSGQSAYILNGSIYVPIRFISESVGTVIKWDSVTKRITGASKTYMESQVGHTHTDSGSTGGSTENTGGQTDGTNNGQTGGSVGGGEAVAATKASIEAAAEVKLKILESSCTNDLYELANQYVKAKDAKVKKQLISQGQTKLDSCTVQFNQIANDTEAQLNAGGFSTEKIAEYRSYFQKQVADGREILEQLTK